MPYPPYVPFRYRSFLEKEKHFKIGLKPLDLNRWLEPDDRFAEELEERERLQRDHFGQVFHAEPLSRASQQNVLDLVLEFLEQNFPDCWSSDSKTITDRIRGRVWVREDFADAPLLLASKLVQDDLVIMTPGETGYRLTAASVCFPSNWDLTEKAGLHLADIHAPVPGLSGRTGQLIDRIFSTLKTGVPAWRINWSIMTHGALFSPSPKGRTLTVTDMETPETCQDWYLRVERQTLRRLPGTGDILFVIRIYHDPFRDLAGHPDGAKIHAGLLSAVKALGEDERRYKGFRDEPAGPSAAAERDNIREFG